MGHGKIGGFGSLAQFAIIMMGHSGLISSSGDDIGSAEKQSGGKYFFKRGVSGVASLIGSE